MRTVEGQGRVAPQPFAESVTSSDKMIICEASERICEYRGYAIGGDVWRVGLLGRGPVHTVVKGLIGELGFVKNCNRLCGTHLELDTRVKPYGDCGVDYVVGRYRVQVKTAVSKYDELLARTYEVNTPKADIFVRCQFTPIKQRPHFGLFGLDELVDVNTVMVCGWVRTDDYQRLGTIEPARRGTHTNYVLQPDGLLSMRNFANLILSGV